MKPIKMNGPQSHSSQKLLFGKKPQIESLFDKDNFPRKSTMDSDLSEVTRRFARLEKRSG